MTQRYLQFASRTIEHRAAKAYRARRSELVRTEVRQESDAEIRAALRTMGVESVTGVRRG